MVCNDIFTLSFLSHLLHNLKSVFYHVPHAIQSLFASCFHYAGNVLSKPIAICCVYLRVFLTLSYVDTNAYSPGLTKNEVARSTTVGTLVNTCKHAEGTVTTTGLKVDFSGLE